MLKFAGKQTGGYACITLPFPPNAASQTGQQGASALFPLTEPSPQQYQKAG